MPDPVEVPAPLLTAFVTDFAAELGKNQQLVQTMWFSGDFAARLLFPVAQAEIIGTRITMLGQEAKLAKSPIVTARSGANVEAVAAAHRKLRGA